MNPAHTIQLMLVDDHFVVRAGIAGSLTLEDDIAVVAECGSGEQAITSFREHQPEVTLMDWRLPELNGVQAVTAIRREFPLARIIMLSAFEGEEHIYQAVMAGVCGYVPKTANRAELLAAVRVVHQGGSYYPPAIAAKLAARRNRRPLNDREFAVLGRIVHGRSNKEAAADLDMATATVKFHVTNILDKLGAADRTQAATIALERGILQLD